MAKGRSREEDSANGKLRVEHGLSNVPLNTSLGVLGNVKVVFSLAIHWSSFPGE